MGPLASRPSFSWSSSSASSSSSSVSASFADEAAGRGASKGYEPIVPIEEIKALPDLFDPGFTNKYDDFAARRAYVMTHRPEP